MRVSESAAWLDSALGEVLADGLQIPGRSGVARHALRGCGEKRLSLGIPTHLGQQEAQLAAPLGQFARPRASGLIALELEEGNTLIGAALTDGHSDVLLTSSSGKAVRFKESDVRAMGRTARGVRGIRLTGIHQVISLIIPSEDGFVLTASENGFCFP